MSAKSVDEIGAQQQKINRDRKDTLYSQFAGTIRSQDIEAKQDAMSIQDFEEIRSLRDGNLGQILLVKNKIDKQQYALKIMNKNQIIKENMKNQVMTEKRILSQLKDQPNFVKLSFTFQDEENLHLGLEYISNCNLNKMLKKMKNLSPAQVQFYAAQLVNILEQLRKCKVAYLDLKPKNLMISNNYHLKLIDFQSAKLMSEDEKKSSKMKEDDEQSGRGKSHRKTMRSSMFGRQICVDKQKYDAPEVFKGEEQGFQTDLWSLGCIIYLLYTGQPLFKTTTEFLIHISAENKQNRYQRGIDKNCIDLIQRLTTIDKKQRIGSKSLDQIKEHPYFNGIDFKNLHKQKFPATQQFKYFTKLQRQKVDSNAAQDDSEEYDFIQKGQQNQIQGATKSSIIKQGLLSKKGRYIWQKRLLKLTSLPSMSYFDPKRGTKKNDIPLDRTVKAVKVKKGFFDIATEQRVWHFRCYDSSQTDEWIDTINKAIANNLQ